MKKPDCKKCREENGHELPENSYANCMECERMKKYQAYLKGKRLFNQGDTINSINELLDQEWVLVFGRGKHIKAIMNMSLRTVLNFLERGNFRRAIRKGRAV